MISSHLPSTRSSAIYSIPIEIHSYLLHYCDLSSLLISSHLSKYWNQVAFHPYSFSSSALTRSIQNKDISSIVRLNGLRSLNISHSSITSTSFLPIASLSLLTNLNISSCHLISTQTLCSILPSLPYLSSLNIHDNPQFSDQIMETLSSLPYPHNIHTLYLGATAISDKGFTLIPTIAPNLTYLDCIRSLIQEDGILSLIACNQLISLSLAHCFNVTEDSIIYLSSFPQLTYLSLAGITVQPLSLLALTSDITSSALIHLELGNLATDTLLNSLSIYSQLTHLSLPFSPITSASLLALSTLPLNRLDISGCEHIDGEVMDLLYKYSKYGTFRNNEERNLFFNKLNTIITERKEQEQKLKFDNSIPQLLLLPLPLIPILRAQTCATYDSSDNELYDWTRGQGIQLESIGSSGMGQTGEISMGWIRRAISINQERRETW